MTTTSDTISRVARVFAETLGADPASVVPGADPESIDGWDSLGHVTMANGLEKEFGLSFDVDELMEMDSIDAILAILQRHGA